MGIIRSPRKESNFYVLDKRISEDKRLSWAARGLLIYLLGKPDHWNVSVEALQNETSASTKPTRRDGVYSLINELMAVGYVKREKKRVGGAFMGYDYMVSEEAEPCTDKADTDSPSTADPTLVSTEVKQELNESKKEAKSAPRPRSKKGEVTFQEWADETRSKGEALIPEDDSIWDEKAPDEYLQLAWMVFSSQMIEQEQKAKNWRMKFRVWIRKDYLRLWAINRYGEYYLTTAGKQAALRFNMGDLVNG